MAESVPPVSRRRKRGTRAISDGPPRFEDTALAGASGIPEAHLLTGVLPS